MLCIAFWAYKKANNSLFNQYNSYCTIGFQIRAFSLGFASVSRHQTCTAGGHITREEGERDRESFSFSNT